MSQPLIDLRKWRDKHNVTFEDLVLRLKRERKFETTKATLSRAEAGKNPMDVDLARHLKAITGLSGLSLRPDLADLMKETAA
jgi:transcriptional regulator with XRE-family HTH domain